MVPLARLGDWRPPASVLHAVHAVSGACSMPCVSRACAARFWFATCYAPSRCAASLCGCIAASPLPCFHPLAPMCREKTLPTCPCARAGTAMGGMHTFATAVEMLQTSYKKMNPFCIPFAISNMGECGGWVPLSACASILGAVQSLAMSCLPQPCSCRQPADTPRCRLPLPPARLPGGAMLAMDLGFMGPNYPISTACATGNYCILR